MTHDSGYAEIALADAALTDQQANGVSFQTAQLTNVDLASFGFCRLQRVTRASRLVGL